MTQRLRFAITGAPVVAALMLAGCKDKGVVEATDASVADVNRKVAASAVKLEPGRWEGAVKIADMKLPAMPPQVRQTIDRQLIKPQGFTSCLTPEKAAKPDAGFFEQHGKDCKYDHFSMANGAIDASLTCAHDGAHQTMTMSGTYGADAYSLDIAMQGSGDGAAMAMKMSVAAKRTGRCTGDEDS